MSDEPQTPRATEEGLRPPDSQKSPTMREADTANGERSDDTEVPDAADTVGSG
ncbi:MAG: hypothetical protein Q8M22_13600 [Actinomycetota bacterium]|nr:hypothetical protein [Actinomycetota bacterium]